MRPSAPTIISAYAVLAFAGAVSFVLPEQVNMESMTASPQAIVSAISVHDEKVMLVALPGLESALIMGD